MKVSAISLIVIISSAHITLAEVIIFVQTPATTGGTQQHTTLGFFSEANGQNFSDLMVLSAARTLTGVDLYISDFAEQNPAIGESVTIRIRSTPTGPILHEFTDPIALIDGDNVGTYTQTVRAHVDFAIPLPLAMGNYWIGMSATNKPPFGFGQVAIMGGSGQDLDGNASTYSGTNFAGVTTLGDQAFRVYALVPEPSSLVLLGLGTVALSGVGRRRVRLSHV